jgi:hypothetical protein
MPKGTVVNQGNAASFAGHCTVELRTANRRITRQWRTQIEGESSMIMSAASKLGASHP